MKNGHKYPTLDIVVELRWNAKKALHPRRKRLFYSALSRAYPKIAAFAAAHPDCLGGTITNRKGTRDYGHFRAAHYHTGFTLTVTKPRRKA